MKMLLAFTLAIGGGINIGAGIVFYSCLVAAVIASQEPPSPIGREPARPGLQWATSGNCIAPCNEYRFSYLGGTP